jgi:two-component system sensor histidine kinase BaeS
MSGRLHGLERSRSRLLADLGHEMRTPLATLEAYLEAYLGGSGGRRRDVGRLHRKSAAIPDQAAGPTVRGHRHRLRVEEGQVGLDLQAVQPWSVVTAAVDSVAEAYNVKGVRLLKQIPPS